MPIEIKELVIRAVVADRAVAESRDDQEGDVRAPGRAGGEASTEEIVQACVREVLRVLKQDRER